MTDVPAEAVNAMAKHDFELALAPSIFWEEAIAFEDDCYHTETYRSKARAALTAALPHLVQEGLAVPAWKPISTAPKDGTKFWAWPCEFEDGPAVVEAFWYVHPAVQGWITDELDCNDFEFKPTHWHPKFPERPAAPAQAEG